MDETSHGHQADQARLSAPGPPALVAGVLGAQLHSRHRLSGGRVGEQGLRLAAIHGSVCWTGPLPDQIQRIPFHGRCEGGGLASWMQPHAAATSARGSQSKRRSDVGRGFPALGRALLAPEHPPALLGDVGGRRFRHGADFLSPLSRCPAARAISHGSLLWPWWGLLSGDDVFLGGLRKFGLRLPAHRISATIFRARWRFWRPCFNS